MEKERLPYINKMYLKLKLKKKEKKPSNYNTPAFSTRENKERHARTYTIP